MSNISQYLAAINSAIYGKDVRGAIHDAIETINDDYENVENDWQDFKEDLIGMTGNVDEPIDMSLLDIRYDTYIASNANIGAKTNDACTATFIPVTIGTVVKVGDLQANIFNYERSVASSYTTQSGYVDTDYTVAANGFIRITVRKDSSSSSKVTESDILSNIRVYLPEFRNDRLNGLRNCLDEETVDYYKGLTQRDGAPILSNVCAMFKRFRISHDKVYYFRFTSTEANAQAVIFAYDSDGNFVTTGRNNDGTYAFYTLMTSSATVLSQSQVIVFPSNVEYIDVMYHFKTITSISLETYMHESEFLSQRIQATNEKLLDLDRKCFYTSRNNKTYVDEIVNVAKSYYNQKDEHDNYRMHYDSSNTVLTESGYDGNGGIDCSTYVGLILRGIPFEETDYATGSSSGEGGDPDQDGDDSGSGSITRSYDANPDYEWSINPHDYEFAESPFSTNKRPVRTAATIAYWLECMGRRVWIDDHLANLLPGDIVFFARKDRTTGDWIQPNRYGHISHIAIITGKTAAPQNANWDTTQFPYAHEMYEVSGVPGACTYHFLEDEDYSGEDAEEGIYLNGTYTLVMVARPDLGDIFRNKVNNITQKITTFQESKLKSRYCCVKESGQYRFANGFCVVGDVAILTRTTGNNNDPTEYHVVSLETGNELNVTSLNTLHSNSLCYNPDTGKIICSSTDHFYTMTLNNDYSITLDSDVIQPIGKFNGIAYYDGTYYLLNHRNLPTYAVYSSQDLVTFNKLFDVELDYDGNLKDGGQSLTVDSDYIYVLSSGLEQRIRKYTHTGEYAGMYKMSYEVCSEIEDADFYNGTLLVYCYRGYTFDSGVYSICGATDRLIFGTTRSEFENVADTLYSGCVINASLSGEITSLLTNGADNTSSRGYISATVQGETYDFSIETGSGKMFWGRYSVASGQTTNVRSDTWSKYESGIVTTDNNGEATVQYAKTHSVEPMVTTMARGSGTVYPLTIKMTAHSNTGFSIVAYNVDTNGTSSPAIGNIMWIAIEP